MCSGTRRGAFRWASRQSPTIGCRIGKARARLDRPRATLVDRHVGSCCIALVMCRLVGFDSKAPLARSMACRATSRWILTWISTSSSPRSRSAGGRSGGAARGRGRPTVIPSRRRHVVAHCVLRRRGVGGWGGVGPSASGLACRCRPQCADAPRRYSCPPTERRMTRRPPRSGLSS